MLTDEAFNNLSWNKIDGEQLSELISGCTILGAEPTGYPLTDGAIFYLQDNSGNLAALELEVCIDEEAILNIKLAKIPKKEARLDP